MESLDTIARRALIGLRRAKPAEDTTILDETGSPFPALHEYTPVVLLGTQEGARYVANLIRDFSVPEVYLLNVGDKAFHWSVYQFRGFKAGWIEKLQFQAKYSATVIVTAELMVFNKDPYKMPRLSITGEVPVAVGPPNHYTTSRVFMDRTLVVKDGGVPISGVIPDQNQQGFTLPAPPAGILTVDYDYDIDFEWEHRIYYKSAIPIGMVSTGNYEVMWEGILNVPFTTDVDFRTLWVVTNLKQYDAAWNKVLENKFDFILREGGD